MRRLSTLGALVLVVCTACTTSLRNSQLEKVAKDWSLVIRASQVIPVYPLSEDLQPGDVLLVSIPIDEQVEIYKNKGFLPLDQHLVRLFSTDLQKPYENSYKNFYNGRYGTAQKLPPELWATQDNQGEHGWGLAPRAAFPSYQFSVKTGAGLNLAIPIQGIPFALGLMNSGQASGTVTIADAYTYGLDNIRLEKQVRAWGEKQRQLLRTYEPRDERYHFLRVVSRVYLTGAVSVTITNDESTSAEAAGGADRPVELLGIKEGATEEDFARAMKQINELAKDQLPGGRVKFASASSRSVTMSEEFERPLVLGYVGFDLPILQGGRLGAPISTLAQLTDQETLRAVAVDNVYRLAALSHMYAALEEIQGKDADRIGRQLDALDSLLPEKYPFSLYELERPTQITKDNTVVTGAAIEHKGFETVLDFLGNAEATVATLEDYLEVAPRSTDEEKAFLELRGELEAARTALEDVGGQLQHEPTVMEAIDFVFLGR